MYPFRIPQKDRQYFEYLVSTPDGKYSVLLIRWCLGGNLVSGLIVIYIASKTRKASLHDKILTAAVCVIVIHSLHALVVSAFFPGRAFLDWGAPYGLAYGPLLFFAMKAAQVNGPFRRGTYFTHAAPFALYYVLYLTSVCVPSSLDILYPVIRNTIFRAIVLSELSKYMGVNRRSLYNWFNLPQIKPEVVYRLGRVIQHDFSHEFPEFFSSEDFKTDEDQNKGFTLQEARTHAGDEEFWKNKYIDLLEKFNRSMLQQMDVSA